MTTTRVATTSSRPFQRASWYKLHLNDDHKGRHYYDTIERREAPREAYHNGGDPCGRHSPDFVTALTG
ncbi:MAG TPA: hypothetical protein VKR42_08865 [Ktedonobacteraceae bacterium]|nr:hypothetical protein [Ktedonobacteraceae bacterium]